MEAFKREEIKRDVINNTICATFTLFGDKYGFCATSTQDDNELPILLVFSQYDEALQFHEKMVQNLANNNYAKKASSIKVMTMEEEYGVA